MHSNPNYYVIVLVVQKKKKKNVENIAQNQGEGKVALNVFPVI